MLTYKNAESNVKKKNQKLAFSIWPWFSKHFPNGTREFLENFFLFCRSLEKNRVFQLKMRSLTLSAVTMVALTVNGSTCRTDLARPSLSELLRQVQGVRPRKVNPDRKKTHVCIAKQLFVNPRQASVVSLIATIEGTEACLACHLYYCIGYIFYRLMHYKWWNNRENQAGMSKNSVKCNGPKTRLGLSIR